MNFPWRHCRSTLSHLKASTIVMSKESSKKLSDLERALRKDPCFLAQLPSKGLRENLQDLQACSQETISTTKGTHFPWQQVSQVSFSSSAWPSTKKSARIFCLTYVVETHWAANEHESPNVFLILFARFAKPVSGPCLKLLNRIVAPKFATRQLPNSKLRRGGPGRTKHLESCATRHACQISDLSLDSIYRCKAMSDRIFPHRWLACAFTHMHKYRSSCRHKELKMSC